MNSTAQPLMNDPVQLQANVVQLRRVVEEKEQAIAEKDQALTEKNHRIAQLLDYILLLRKRQFSPTADRPNKDQLSQFDQAELEQLVEEPDQAHTADNIKLTPKEKGNETHNTTKHRPLSAQLNRVEKIIDFSDQEKALMGEEWRLIGFDTSQQLAIIPR